MRLHAVGRSRVGNAIRRQGVASGQAHFPIEPLRPPEDTHGSEGKPAPVSGFEQPRLRAVAKAQIPVRGRPQGIRHLDEEDG
jgi:hypothetical protein